MGTQGCENKDMISIVYIASCEMIKSKIASGDNWMYQWIYWKLLGFTFLIDKLCVVWIILKAINEYINK